MWFFIYLLDLFYIKKKTKKNIIRYMCQTQSLSPRPDIRREAGLAAALFMGTLPQ